MREVSLQVRVGTKAGVKIGRNQECVAANSYKGVKDFRLRGILKEECILDVHIGRVNNASAVYWQFCIKAVRNGLARPSPPQIAIYVTTPGLKCGVRLVRNSIVSQTKSQAKVLTGTLTCE